MRIALAIGGILIVVGSFLPWAWFNDGILQYFPEYTGLQLGHGAPTVLAGIGIVLLATDGARRLATRSRRTAGLLVLVLLAALFPSVVYREQALPWTVIAAALVLVPSAEAIRRAAARPDRSTLLLVLIAMVDLVVLGIGFAFHDAATDGRQFDGVGLGLIIVVLGAAVATVAARRLEAVSGQPSVTDQQRLVSPR